MAEYTLKLRRYTPESGEAAYWQEFTIDLDGHRSVLDGILQAKDREDGSIGIRCSCRAAICGSCGVRINGRPALACHTHLDEAAKVAHGEGWNPPDEGQTTAVITVEPMGNMPVLKDLIVDMDAVHWKKIQRVTPWLIPDGPPPEREYVVPPESMIDITQTMACIKGVAPMSQIMRLRRIAGNDQKIVDRNNGHRHEEAFTGLVRDYGLNHEAELLPRSYGGNSWFGKFHPNAGLELANSHPVIVKAQQ